MARLVERNQQLQTAQTNLKQQHDVALALQRSLLGVHTDQQPVQQQQGHIEAQLDAALHNAHYKTPKVTSRAPRTPPPSSDAQVEGPTTPAGESQQPPPPPPTPPPETDASLSTTVPMGHQSPAIDLLTPAPAQCQDSSTEPATNLDTPQLAARDANDRERDAAIRAQEAARKPAHGRGDLSDSDSFDLENDFRLAKALQAQHQSPTEEWVTQAAAIHLPDADAGIETDHEGFTSSSAGPDIPPPNKVHKGRATEPFPWARRASSLGKTRPNVGPPGPKEPTGSPRGDPAL
jgi:hypothetical protein